MAKYKLNTTELALLRYMNRHLMSDKEVLKCSFDMDIACKALELNESELTDVIERLEANYIVINLGNGEYSIAQEAYDAINKAEVKGDDKDTPEEEKPFRLNSDTYNYSEDEDTDYESIELKFSDLRADDSIHHEDDGLEESEEKIVEEKTVKKKKKNQKGLTFDDFSFDMPVDLTDSSMTTAVNKNITVYEVPSGESEDRAFRLNGDTYTENQAENVYGDQHIDFSDMRGGDLSRIDEEHKKDELFLSERITEQRDIQADRSSLTDFSPIQQKEGIRKVTKNGDTVMVSSVLEDNKGPVLSAEKGALVEGGTFIRDASINGNFNSYEESKVDNSINYSTYVRTESKMSEPIRALFDKNASTNIGTASSVSVSMFKDETKGDSDREQRILKFDAIKRVDGLAIGETQVNSTLNNDVNIHTSKNMTGSVSGKIDYDIGSTKLNTETIGVEDNFNRASDAFSGRTQDVERNSDLRTARKEANVEMVKNFHTYNFAKIATESGINELRSATVDVTTGIQGSYTDDMMPAYLATVSVAEAIAAKAVFEASKFNQAQEDRAFSIAEKLNETGINIDTLNRRNDVELKELITDNGFSEKDAEILYKKVDFVAREFTYRQEIVKKAKEDPLFLSGNEELKEYLKNNGFKRLSAKNQIEILNELNRTNKNAEIRNLDLRRLNKRQIEKLLKRNGIDSKSRLLLDKTKGLRKRAGIEEYAGRHSFLRSVARATFINRPSQQDLFGNTVKDAYRKTRSLYDGVVIKIVAVKVLTDFAKKAYKAGNGFKRVGNEGFVKINDRSFSKLRQDGLKYSSLKPKSLVKGAAKAFSVKSILKAGKQSVSDSLYQSESEEDEKQKKEKKEDLTNRISGAIDKKKAFNKLSKKVAEKSSKAMKNATEKGFVKAGEQGAKKALGSTIAKGTTAAATKAGAASAAGATGATASATATGTAAGLSVGAVAAIIIAIIIIIIVIIAFLMYMFDGFAMASYEGSSIVKEDMKTFGNDLGEAFSDGIHKMEHTAILVSDTATDNDEYVDIKKYLEKIQALDEKREKDVLTFANAKIGTYSPESMGLESRQMNGKYGQDSSILAGHTTQYYGSEDKKNGYTLHYLDAYGNEIANHSTNAKDVMTLCAVLFSNQPDDDDVFQYLIEDQWYLMSPKIKWKESDIYCCDTCKAEYNGYGYNLTTCKSSNNSSKYRNNGERMSYHCNKYSEVSKIQHLKNQGCKVEGDVRLYDYEGCEQREVSTYFYGDGYDTYDLYLDDYISYDDYRWYVEYYGSDYFSKRFYKYEWYCPGNHEVVVCYGHKDIDIYITVYDKEYAISNNIYPNASNSHTGRYSQCAEYLEDFLDSDKWSDDENTKWVDDLYDQDWYDIYGLDVLGGVGFNIGGSLTDADIDSILENLSEEELSLKQQAIIEFGLKYVGKIPYYWGGKASSLNFESNHFDTTVEADYKGRTKKGLDCSGFVQWVMANNGIKVPGSTAGYSSYSTYRDHSQLKVGDLGFCNLPGSSSNHVGIYAGVDENGNDLWIHCAGSSGTVVNNYNGFKYYISLGGL